MFLGQGVLWEQVWSSMKEMRDELRLLRETRPTELPRKAPTGNLQDYTNNFKEALLDPGAKARTDKRQSGEIRTGQKRQRSDTATNSPNVPSPTVHDFYDGIIGLPPDNVVNELVDLYFSNLQPWIPILHTARFKERMADVEKRASLTTIFHAIVSVCARFSRNPYFDNARLRASCLHRHRHIVILNSMESFSIENLQALIIIGFDTVCFPHESRYNSND